MIHYLPTFGDSCLLILNPVYWAYLFEDNKVEFIIFHGDYGSSAACIQEVKLYKLGPVQTPLG